MKKTISTVFFLFGLLLLAGNQVYAERSCQFTTPALQTMQQQNVVLYKDDLKHELNTKIARSFEQRQAGFQYICKEIIRDTAILFLFETPFKPRFHMNNVNAPLDIAFIKANGEIISIQTMRPYSLISFKKPVYGVDENVQAAIEAHKGFFEQAGISVGWKIEGLSKLINENKQ